MDFSGQTRLAGLEKAAEGVIDILVVGGGITGAGVAREAALKGFSVLLVDKGDFASGTSSRSSKLIHGGVRYLQQGDIGLVREAARERAVLHRMAPHLARPVSMMVPAASKAGLLKVAAGLWTFDRLAAEPRERRHRTLDQQATRSAEPNLTHGDRLAGSVIFTEYVTNDARLTLETVKSAAAAGGLVANYAELQSLTPSAPGFRAAVRDRQGEAALEVRARCVVNAGGPWMDSVRKLAQTQPDMLQLTRGIHLVVSRSKLPVEHSVVLRAPDGRSTFVVPAGAYSYIGTTDTYYDGEREEPGVSLEDADYLLESVAATFENAPGRDDIVGTWSGVRPLLRQDGKAPSEISRRDEIVEGPGPMISVAGGKLTTYRRMAERVIERACNVLGEGPRKDVDSASGCLSGGGSDEQAEARRLAPRLQDESLENRLWATYGCAAAEIVARIRQDPGSAAAVEGIEGLSLAEVDHFVDSEMATSLDDVLRRRCTVGMFDARAAIAGAVEVAARLARTLSWSDARRDREVETVTRLLAGEFGAVRSGPSGRQQ